LNEYTKKLKKNLKHKTKKKSNIHVSTTIQSHLLPNPPTLKTLLTTPLKKITHIPIPTKTRKDPPPAVAPNRRLMKKSRLRDQSGTPGRVGEEEVVEVEVVVEEVVVDDEELAAPPLPGKKIPGILYSGSSHDYFNVVTHETLQ
jgi:hypothetical protein